MPSLPVPANPESVFTYGAPALRFGRGASEEIWHDVVSLGVRRVLVVTDAGVAATGAPQRIADSIAAQGIQVLVYDESHVEPTDESLRQAVDYAAEHGPWDAFVAVGGGSSIDTAKAVNLMSTNDGELLDYVNPPVGGGRSPANPLKPLIAVPTTTGTGSESTTICVLDVLSAHVKTGISHLRLRPTLAVVDPLLTMTQPSAVTAASGLDILCHALESWTARPYTAYDRTHPTKRVPYCGANPVSDLWAERALRLLAGAFRAAVADGDDEGAREQMALAATFAGMGFGNAGVHIPHANAYPVAGRVRDFRPAGYPQDAPMVPHGMAVALTAPAAFRFTYDADPDRHLAAARWLDPRTSDPGADVLARVVVELMQDVGMPNGLSAVGYAAEDVPALVEGSLQQQRLLATSPKAVNAADLEAILESSMTLW